MSRHPESYKKAVDAIEEMFPKAKFIIRPIRKHSSGKVLWECKTLDTTFRDDDFIEVIRMALEFAAKAHGII